jgi:electron transfer flavoprotein alpha subunit
MAWTQIELDALKAAYARGTLRVTYDGKTVEYGSEADLKRRIETLASALAAEAGQSRPTAGFAGYARGDG